ncbi:MAG TPA: uroporphyrinogen decarboxylase family protein [Anaerolineae bacterium]|nr:uroporphyrinogen decarboxylase family protein [Anaerolineae bacterium]
MRTELSSRERVLLAINHREPDRVPVVLGADGGTTSMLAPAYDNLKRHLGIVSATRLLNRAFQYVEVDEEVMAYFQADVRPLFGPASSRFAAVDGPGDEFTDYWGITWQRSPGDIYYHMARQPLKAARTPEDIEAYPWPNAEELLDLDGLEEKARWMSRESPYAILGFHAGPSSLFEQSWYLRGLPEMMVDLATNLPMVHALLRKMTDLAKACAALYLGEVGQYIHIFQAGDDLGIQTGLLVSPTMFRAIIKPYLAEYYALIHNLTDAKLMMHSCGGVAPIIEDLIEIGVDILNPVQVSAAGMDPALLKARFGDRLCFCGGIDTQHILPHGSPAEVKEEVRRRIQQMAPGGGYLLAAVHAIQADVPPQNVCAMFEAAARYGRYPVA